MSADLMAFLRARVDEDEALARAATPGPWMDELGYVTAIGPDGQVQVTDFGTQDGEPEDPTPQGNADSAHIARHGPARVLAEVKAKRRILDRHQPHSMGGCRVCEAPHWGVKVCNHCYGQEWPCPDVRDLVAVYAGHPDYRPEWAPDA